ncbi:septal ring lytic transglycosylase RlpA family protein [uncultured Pseudacidovorax sp.]|uniref:septal ring lytic transglycosylase RlpA family protein n=1 Tax=uncultured Pseudacidovorax sp. TaxID=679313 RepID=UPI0025F24E6C|nr:septal ring lytic transglycosylase RlpA family protein [uncultured Pseudacidovorax sp.]
MRGHAPVGMPLRWATWAAACAAAVLAGCASAPRDGPPRNPPAGLAQTPDAEPRVEPIRAEGGTSRPYTVAGRSYTPLIDDRPLVERGLASWYGQGFHARSTATGEPYDMYAMTAAHRTMPLPSYARVRNPANGREVIVRVNDRGPFRDDRIIDLSYTAALRLDLLRGVAPVEVERLTNEAIRTGAWRRPSDTQLAASPASPARAEAVPVPAAWVQPVAAVPSGAAASPSTSAPVPVWRLAQASTAVASDAAPASAAAEPPAANAPAAALPAEPPPRFRNMEVAPLAPMTPAPVPAPAAAAPASPAAPAATLPGSAASAGALPPSAAGATASASSAIAAGVWMQLGAFRERDGAQTLLARVAASQPELAGRLRIVEEAGAHKVQVGPYATRDAAQAAVGPLRGALGLSPFAVERR